MRLTALLVLAVLAFFAGGAQSAPSPNSGFDLEGLQKALTKFEEGLQAMKTMVKNGYELYQIFTQKNKKVPENETLNKGNIKKFN
ncbi:unnamed protein product [Spodoptera exigua]|nr:unnamed protein product [Spodoptera exigua]